MVNLASFRLPSARPECRNTPPDTLTNNPLIPHAGAASDFLFRKPAHQTKQANRSSIAAVLAPRAHHLLSVLPCTSAAPSLPSGHLCIALQPTRARPHPIEPAELASKSRPPSCLSISTPRSLGSAVRPVKPAVLSVVLCLTQGRALHC